LRSFSIKSNQIIKQQLSLCVACDFASLYSSHFVHSSLSFATFLIERVLTCVSFKLRSKS
jgi:hypothetical protein